MKCSFLESERVQFQRIVGENAFILNAVLKPIILSISFSLLLLRHFALSES